MLENILWFIPENIQTTASSFFDNILPWWWVWVLFVIFLWLISKYTDKDFFGLQIVTWAFWSWKTYNNSLETKNFSEEWLFIISNIRNSFTNLKFDSSLDLERVFSYIMKYAEITNKESFIKLWFRPIVFNIDECHNYFFSRNFWENMNGDNVMVLTQLRKRNILANFITQELAQLDIFIRRLSQWMVKRYYAGLWFIRFWRLYYVPSPDTTNLESEEEWVQVVKKWMYFAPTFLLFLSKKRRNLLKEKHISKIIVWYEHLLKEYKFTDFLIDLYPLESDFWKEFWKVYKKEYWEKEFKTQFENIAWLKEEEKRIKTRMYEIKVMDMIKKIKKFDLKNLINNV